MPSQRRTRPTLRCVKDDLGLPVPPLDQSLESLDHPALTEARRLAPASPTGQKRVQVITQPLVYRLRQSRWRGATWVERDHHLLWLLAVAQREEGSRDDAFEYFERLHDKDELLPGDDDRLRDRAEGALRLLRDAKAKARPAIDQARAQAGTTLAVMLDERVEVRLHAESGDILWIGIRTGTTDKRPPLKNKTVGTLFSVFLEALEVPYEYEDRVDWVTGEPLPWWLVARMVLTS